MTYCHRKTYVLFVGDTPEIGEKVMNMRPFRELPDYHSPTHRSKVAFLANCYCKSSYPFAYQMGQSNGHLDSFHSRQSHPKVRTPKSIQTCQSNIHHGDLFWGQIGQEFIELYGLAIGLWAQTRREAFATCSECKAGRGKHGKTS